MRAVGRAKKQLVDEGRINKSSADESRKKIRNSILKPFVVWMRYEERHLKKRETKARPREWMRRYSRDRFLGRQDIFGAGHGLVGDNAGGYVHDELDLLTKEAVVALNEDERAVRGRVDEPHIVGSFVAPMERVEGRGACRGREASRAVLVKVPYKRGALLGFFPPAGSGRRRVSVVRSRLQAKHGRGRKLSSHI